MSRDTNKKLASDLIDLGDTCDGRGWRSTGEMCRKAAKRLELLNRRLRIANKALREWADPSGGWSYNAQETLDKMKEVK